MRQPRIAALHVRIFLTMALALAVFSTPALAEMRLAVLNGVQENPSISTTAIGVFIANIADDEQSIDSLLIYTAVEGGTAMVAHIHFARDGVNGAIVINLCGTTLGLAACPTPGGTVTRTLTPADVLNVPAQGIAAGELAEVIAAMRSGATYANVHSTNFPSGEIRGQIK